VETGKFFFLIEISVLDIKGKPSCNQQAFSDTFNNYFLSIADTFTKNNTHNKNGTNQDTTFTPLYILSKISKNSFAVKGV
jgi:hypothetical protein